MATRSQFDLKIAIRLVAVPLAAATATATHLKIQLRLIWNTIKEQAFLNYEYSFKTKKKWY